MISEKRYPCPIQLTKGRQLVVDQDGNIITPQGTRLKPRRWRHFRYSPRCHSTYPIVGDDLLAHRVICAAIYGPPLPGQVCDHLDGNIFNNHPSNLQWVTPAENMRRARLMRCMRKIGLAPLWLYPGILRGLYSLPTEQAELIIERFRAQTTITDDPLTIPNINATLAFLLDELKENITNGQWPKQGPRRALT